jgi:basic membrane lipoprotein Med (substrate-binding protein (PBP1-ABC) superfamily)
MKIKNLFLLLPLLLSGCSNNNFSSSISKHEKNGKVLICYSGDEIDEYPGIVVEEAVKNLTNNNYEIETLSLGMTTVNYESKLNTNIDSIEYDKVILIGEDTLRFCEKSIKVRQGIQFFAIDDCTNISYSNLHHIDFSPIEISYLSGLLVADYVDDNNVAYIANVKNSYSNQELYGFLFGLEEQNVENKIGLRYLEEKDNYIKINDYIDQYIENSYNTFYTTSNNSVYYINRKISSNQRLIPQTSIDLSVYSNIEVGINKSYSKAIDYVLNIDNNEEYLDRYILDYSSKAYEIYGIDKINKNTLDKINNMPNLSQFDSEKFQQLKNKYIVDDNELYSPKSSVYSGYHEAIPNCSESNDWKYAPRPGADNGKKPASWKALGIWATIYQQDSHELSKNTGIEFKNMKLYGYSKRLGWRLIEHANPTGSFYDENFTNDSSKNFTSNFFNSKDTKTSKVKLDTKTKGFNYHPFGEQNDLTEIDMLDIEYVFSRMDIRLVTWDTTLPSDIDDAKYVANIGADWWVEKGSYWKEDWSSNRDVCVGQFRTITEDWKSLYMCSVPLDLYDEILQGQDFYK